MQPKRSARPITLVPKIVCIFTLIATSGMADAQVAQPSTSGQTEPSAHVVLFTAAGGISKGSYQGGVDWTITEFLRRMRDRKFREALHLTDRRYMLGAATGASAGNIDALFAAIHYCTDRRTDANGEGVQPLRAEDSLFWKAWISTGTPQMLPLENGSNDRERAVFDRTFFETEYLPAIKDALVHSVATEGCAVPVGLTLTRIEPVEVSLVEGSSATAAVQRFAAVFSVRRTASGSVEFRAPSPATAERRSLGALALLDHDAGGRIEPEQVFNAAIASSSFPIAFAPRKVKYSPGGLGAEARRTATLEGSAFSDGGVFDNNPMSLAVGLYEQQPTPQRKADIVYSSPDSFRQPMLDARTPCSPMAEPTAREKALGRGECNGKPVSGIGAATALLSGAYAAARQYELQAFARQLDRDKNFARQRDHDENIGALAVVPDLRVSTRAHAIVGETLMSFGGFLGRPFREHDFYTGIYDGLEFIAREFLCRDEADVPRCTRERHKELILAEHFALSPEARAVAEWLLHYEECALARREHKSTEAEDSEPCAASATAATVSPSSDRWTLIRAVLWGVSAPETIPALKYKDCNKAPGLMAQHLCQGGLDNLLSGLHGDKAVRAAVDSIQKFCTKNGLGDAKGDCPVDSHFVELIDHPAVHLYRLEKKAIENLELAEDSAKQESDKSSQESSAADSAARPKLPEYTSLVEAAFSVFRTATYRYRDGALGPLEFVISTARSNDPTDKWALALGYALPSYFQWTFANGRKDNLSFGWRPVTWVLNEQLHVNYTTEVSLTGLSQGPFFTNALSHSLGLGSFALTRHVQRLAAAEIGVLLPGAALWNTLPGSRFGERARDRLMARLTLRVLADKILVTVSGRKDVLTFGLGVHDINGVAFWVKR